MGNKRSEKLFKVVVYFATDPNAPTLAQVQAEAAPLITQLLVQAIRKHQTHKEIPSHCYVLANSSARA